MTNTLLLLNKGNAGVGLRRPGSLRRKLLVYGTLSLGVLAHAWLASGESCPTLTPEDSTKLAAYVAKRYELAPDVGVQDDGLVSNTCFRRLTFQSRAPRRPVVLYLSPDRKFLTPELLDLAVDPAAERERVSKLAEAELLGEPSPTRGSTNAPVTIVEFSDFQCPYCRKFDEFLRQAAPRLENVRVVFKEFPLPSHAWARSAALAAICASRQGTEAFWNLHDFFFANQGRLNLENFDGELSGFVGRDGVHIDAGQLQGCLAKHEADSVLGRDELLGQRYHVEETPTVFINGRRTVGFRSAEELRTAIDQVVTLSGTNNAQASLAGK